MEKYLLLLQDVPLFSGIAPEALLPLLASLDSRRRRYGKGALLWEMGDLVTHVGIVLCGCVDAIEYLPDGEEHLSARQTAGSVFGDLLMAAGTPSPVTLRAAAETTVLFLPLERILQDCGSCSPDLVRLRRNLLQEIACKYWQLRRRIRYLQESRLEKRVLLFLEDQRALSPGDYITVPYSRRQMADILGSNRSALSRTLGTMQRRGILSYYRNSFRLMPQDNSHSDSGT